MYSIYHSIIYTYAEIYMHIDMHTYTYAAIHALLWLLFVFLIYIFHLLKKIYKNRVYINSDKRLVCCCRDLPENIEVKCIRKLRMSIQRNDSKYHTDRVQIKAVERKSLVNRKWQITQCVPPDGSYQNLHN